MQFKKINIITGWFVFAIAAVTYILTTEAAGSLWDCGEFVSTAYKLQNPHPPGAPLFTLIGRFFVILFGDNPLTAGKAVNIMSALASAFTILFLFWTITHLAHKLVRKGNDVLSVDKIWGIMAAGAVGALAYTFSDSFWYSAVEGEVYALSSFFTAIVFWGILKWENAADKPGADKWIVFTFFMIGLSIGVHLLSLLTIPAITMVYYHKKYKTSKKGFFLAFIIACLLTGIVQKLVIQYSMQWAGKFDILFVNNFNLPFFSGFAFFFVLLAVVIYIGLRIAQRKQWSLLRLGLWCFTFMMIGYSTYVVTLIRSNADTSIDMYNVDNPINLVGYLGREQYGDFPLVYGQHFAAQPTETKEGAMKYEKSKDKYVEVGKDISYVYDSKDMMFFPRIWDASNEQGHADYYAHFLGMNKLENGSYDREPTFGDNLRFFFQYQINWMYIRYFMWNFVGKQNDIQGVWDGNPRDGNWISGISIIDNLLYGDQSKMPDSIKNNKSNNTLFFLPFILGILGWIYQYKRDKKDWWVNLLLFFFTGIAIILYTNPPGNQPRERDYAFVGSFYAFAIWIGLGVLQVKEWLSKKMTTILATQLSTAICLLAVPVLMGFQEWDDHDRSQKLLPRDIGKNYLESCAPNAILITFGDNDTYPLWYAQEVEGIRPDIRIINYALLGADWYINQLRYKVNQSDPIDVIWTADQIEGRKRDAVYYSARPGIPEGQFFDLYDVMKNYVGSDDPANMAQTNSGESLNTFPVKKFFVSADEKIVKQNGTVNATDTVVSQMVFEVPKNVLMKNESAVLNIIAANKWKRPICFTSPYEINQALGLGNYLRQDGLSYRLVPVAGKKVNTDVMFNNLMNKFSFGNAQTKGVYFDEENRRHLNSFRSAFAELANSLVEEGRQADAIKALERCDKMMSQSNFPYGMVSRNSSHNYISLLFLQACYNAGDISLAKRVSNSISKDLIQQMQYYEALSEGKQAVMVSEIQQTQGLLQYMNQIEKQATTSGNKKDSVR